MARTDLHPDSTPAASPPRGPVGVYVGLVALLVLVVSLVAGSQFGRGTRPVAEALLWNGQQLQIEAVTFGTNVTLGRRDRIGEWLGGWLPGPVASWLAPTRGFTRWTSEDPQLVVWLNGFDPAQRRFVDCQGFRIEIMDEHGDLYPAGSKAWYGFGQFSRVAHGFTAFPRRGANLRIRATAWNTNLSYTFTVPNPRPISSVPTWDALPPPQTKEVDGLSIRLTGLFPKTNGGPGRYWESPSRHWFPQLELFQAGLPATGWLEPEWWAEDPTGNRGQAIGLHEPIQRFHVLVFPAATNALLDTFASVLPRVDLTQLGSGQIWRQTGTSGPVVFEALGVLPAGTHLFSGGQWMTNPPPTVRLGPVGGGAPSGWVGQSERLGPSRFREWHGHYTPVPTLYLRAPTIPGDDRIAVRLRDDQGRLYVAEPEDQGRRDDVRPFLLKLPAEVTYVTLEVVFVRPRSAEFTVLTPALDRPGEPTDAARP